MWISDTWPFRPVLGSRIVFRHLLVLPAAMTDAENTRRAPKRAGIYVRVSTAMKFARAIPLATIRIPVW
jgi:hypothetical protein